MFLAHPFGEILASLPGIGPRTGARILAEIGDGSGFASGAKLAAYAGLAPVTRQSGTSCNAETRSRRGNHRLKNAMFLAAFASREIPRPRPSMTAKRAEGKRAKRRPDLPRSGDDATSSSPCSETASTTSLDTGPGGRQGRLTMHTTTRPRRNTRQDGPSRCPRAQHPRTSQTSQITQHPETRAGKQASPLGPGNLDKEHGDTPPDQMALTLIVRYPRHCGPMRGQEERGWRRRWQPS